VLAQQHLRPVTESAQRDVRKKSHLVLFVTVIIIIIIIIIIITTIIIIIIIITYNYNSDNVCSL
jgi:heme/copper-type cytochrome/quinol oxidase subunit 2